MFPECQTMGRKRETAGRVVNRTALRDEKLAVSCQASGVGFHLSEFKFSHLVENIFSKHQLLRTTCYLAKDRFVSTHLAKYSVTNT